MSNKTIIKILSNITDNYLKLNDYTKLFPHASLPQFEIHLVEHCNLNCKGCNNFSSIAEKEFVDEKKFSDEMYQMGKLFSGYLGKILLLGGEPLLHPNIAKLLKITRENFPTTKILIVTNALKLKSMHDDFWKSCRDNDIIISITKYPVIKNYDSIENTLLKNHVKYMYFAEGNPRRPLEKVPIDLDGCLDGNHMWLKCYKAINCAALKNGRLYPCSFASNIQHFIKKFDVPHVLEVPEDSIDIYKHTREEILEFLTHPIPMCRYCNLSEKKRNIPFGISEGKIDEWI